MVMGGSGGAGIARAGIQVDTSSLERSKQVVVQSAQQIGNAFNQMGRQSQQSIVTVNNDLKNLGNTANQTSSSLGTLFSGAFVAGGLAAAQNLRRVDTLFGILSGSQELVNERMAELAELSKRTGIPMLQLKESAVTLLPAIGRNNVELSKTLSIAQRLAILDPAQGAAGAAFALREFMGGEYRSLAARFEIPLEVLKRIRTEAGGNAQAMIDGLDAYINKLGLTEGSLKEMADAGITAFDNAKVALREAVAVGFMPLLQVITPLLQGFTKFLNQLNQTNPEILKIAALTVAAVAGVNLLAASFGRMSAMAASAAANATLAGRATKAIGAVGVAAAGAEAGVGIARGLGQLAVRGGSDNERLRQLSTANQSEARDMLFDDLKKGLFVFVDLVRQAALGLVPIAGIIEVGRTMMQNAWDLLVTAIQIGATKFTEAIGNMLLGIGQLLNWIDGAADKFGIDSGLGSVVSSLTEAGNQTVFNSQRERYLLEQNRPEGIGLSDEQRQRIQDSNAALHELVDGGFHEFQTALLEMLFPAQEAAEAVEEASNAFSELGSKSGALKDAVASAREVIEEFRGEMKKVADERARQSGREEEDFLRKRQRDLEEFGRQQAETETNRNQDRIDKIKDFQDQEGEALTSAMADRLKAEQAFAAAEIERALEHEKNLEKIKLDGARAVEDAAANLDARSVAAALRSTNEKLSNANTTFAEETQQKNKQFQQQLAEDALQFSQMQAQKAAQFVQQMADEEVNFAAQRAKQLEEFQRRQGLEDEDRALKLQRQQEDWAREDELRRQKADEQLVKLATEIDAEKALQDQWLANMREFLDGSRQSFDQYIKSIDASTKQFMIDQQKVAEDTTSPTTSKGLQQGISRYALGGRPPLRTPVLVGEGGPELAMFDHPARIYSNPETMNLMRIMAAPTPAMPVGSMGGSAGNISMTVTQNYDFGDIGNYQPEQLVTTIKHVWNEQMTELLTKAGQPS